MKDNKVHAPCPTIGTVSVTMPSVQHGLKFKISKILNFLNSKLKTCSMLFVAVFLGCTSTGRVGLCFLWFYVQELLKAQPAVVLVLKRVRRLGNSLKSHPTDQEEPGIKPATPGLSPTPRRLLNMQYAYKININNFKFKWSIVYI